MIFSLPLLVRSNDPFHHAAVTINNDGAAYTLLDQLGDVEALTVPKSGIIQGISVWDAEGRNPSFDILFFKTQPTLTNSNNGAFGMDLSNWQKMVPGGRVRISSSEYVPTASFSENSISKIGIPYNLDSTTLYMACQIRSAPDYTNSDALSMGLTILRV